MIFEEIREIICEQLGSDKDEVRLEISLEELGADSLDLFQIITELEQKYNIEIEEVEDINTIQDAVNLVEKEINNKNSK